MNHLYDVLRLYTNFFQPQMKLVNKTRKGSKVYKKYDKAQTPYQRIQNKRWNKNNLKVQCDSLNPVSLQREIIRIQDTLLEKVKKNQFYQNRRLNKQKTNMLLYRFFDDRTIHLSYRFLLDRIGGTYYDQETNKTHQFLTNKLMNKQECGLT